MSKLEAGRDRGGNPFAIANAVKPSKAPINLSQMAEDRLSREEAEKLLAENRRLRETLVHYEDRMARKRRKIEDLELRCGRVQSQLAQILAMGHKPDPELA